LRLRSITRRRASARLRLSISLPCYLVMTTFWTTDGLLLAADGSDLTK